MATILSLSGVLLNLKDTSETLKSFVGRYYIDYLKNFNFVSNDLEKLNINLQKINDNFSKIESFNNQGYQNYLTEKLESVEKTFKEMFTVADIPISTDLINNNIYFNLYNKNNELVIEKQKFNFSDRLNSVYVFPFDPAKLEIESGIYNMTIFYENQNSIFEFDGEFDVIDFVFSRDMLLERIILDNQKNKISKDLRNYKIYLVNKNTNIVKYKETILNSTITNTELDITCFSLNIGSVNYKDFIFIIKEELFDTVNIELTIGDYSLNDIGNVILGNAERDLITGEFKVFDSAGNLISTSISTRFGRKEYRKRIE